MAHGGHSGGGHCYHYHHSYRSGGRSATRGEVLLCVGIVIALVTFFAIAIDSNLSGKKPLEGEYETYPSYVIDEAGYFQEKRALTAGLKYIHEKTNVQVVVMSSNDSWSDAKAVDKYYELFDDEAHVLIICPTAWYSSTVYYAIGDLADTVIDDYAVKYLIDGVDKSNKGSKWKTYLISLTDKLLRPKD